MQSYCEPWTGGMVGTGCGVASLGLEGFLLLFVCFLGLFVVDSVFRYFRFLDLDR